MQFTLIVPDGTMAIDGVGHQINVSSAPSGLHAVQWYGTWGEEEWSDDRGRMVRNQEITETSSYQWAIDAWNVAEQEAQAAATAAAALSAAPSEGPTVI